MLITAEIALTVMLLVGSGLMLKSFYRLMSQDFGMNTENVGTLEATFARSGVAELAVQGTPARRMEIVRRALAQLRADRRIAAAGVINDLPLRASGGIAISIQLIGAPTPTKENYVRFLIADAGYFQAMRIPLLQGRLFEAGDDSIGQRSVIVSQALADKYWPGVTPLGRTFHFGGDTSHAYAVVGVVADVRESSLEDDLRPQLYFHVEEMGVASIAIVARGDLPGNALLARMRAAVREASPSQAIYNLRMMREVVAKSVAPRRTNTALIAIFGGLALVLSAFGVYAVVSYSVTQRSREFGIRAALGARRADILALVGGDASRLIMIGLAAGLAGAWMISRILASLLYEVDVHDFLTFALVPLVLIVPVALATRLPSLRATRVSPTEVMRAE
jgi:putative ABC transport system permease protein